MAVKVMRNRNTKKWVARNSSQKTLTLAKKSTHPGEQHISSETRYRMLIENLPQKIFLKDKNSVYISCNQNMARDLKINIDEIAGKTDCDFFPRKLAVKYRADDVRIMNSGETEEIEKSYMRKGQVNYIHSVKTPISAPDGSVIGLLVVSWDVTAHNKLEKELEKQCQNLEAVVKERTEELRQNNKRIEWDGIERRRWQELLRSLLNSSTVGIYITQNGKFLACNPKFDEITGYNKDELLGRRSLSLILPADRDAARNSAISMLKGQNQIPYEFRLTTRGGEVKWVVESVASVMYQGRQAVLGNFMDITERKRAEEALRASEVKYKTLFESFPLGVTVSDKTGNIIESNKEAERLLGLSFEEHTERKIDGREWRIIRPDGSPMQADEYASVRALKENRLIENVEMGIVKDDSGVTWINVTATPIPLEGYGVAIAYGDITDRKQAEEMLRRREREFSTLVESIPVMIVRFDTDLRHVYCNTAVERQLGVPVGTFIGKTSLEIGMPAEQAKFVDKALRRALKTGQEQEVEQSIPLPSGTKHFLTRIVPEFDAQGRIEFLLAITHDLTRRKQAEEVLLDNEKKNRELVEQLHRLVGNTIAAQEAERERICLEVHDGVAQTMASAFQYLQGMESNLPADSPYVDLINKAKAQMKHAIQEAREVINSLQPATLKDLGLIPTLRQEMYKIEEESGWKVNFNAPAQRFPPAMEIGLYRIIHEAITNIKKHTRTHRVDISISTDGQYINVLIRDHGKGFDQDSPDILKKKGVGLISMRKRAELLQGTLNIESIPGRGTTLIIKIPFDGEV